MPQRFLELNKTARHNDFSYKIEFSKKHGIDRRGEIHASKVTRKKKKEGPKPRNFNYPIH